MGYVFLFATLCFVLEKGWPILAGQCEGIKIMPFNGALCRIVWQSQSLTHYILFYLRKHTNVSTIYVIPQTDMIRVVEILPHVRQELTYST